MSIQNYFITEPYRWLQYCFFQPTRFQQTLEPGKLTQRLIMMVRLLPLLFFYAYTPALIIRIILYSTHPELFPHYALQAFVPCSPTIGWFLLDATWATAVSCIAASFFCGLFSIRFGIATALALSLADGVIVNTGNDTFVGIVFGLAFGLLVGIAFNSANVIKLAGLEHVTFACTVGVVGGLVVGFCTGTFGGYWSGFLVGNLYPALQNQQNIAGSVAGMTVGALGGIALKSLLGFLFKKSWPGRQDARAFGLKIGIAVAAAFGAAVGIPVGDAGMTHLSFLQGIQAGIQQETIAGIAFLCCYLLCYYRLPLYPFSAYSSIQAYFAARSKLQQALYCLHNSALNWDECVFLPLPYLKQLLLIAAGQNLDETLNELNFIVKERPQQRGAALFAAYNLALDDLHQRKILREVGQAHQRLAHLLSPQLRTANPQAQKAFRAIDDASREAESYLTQQDRLDRLAALGRMRDALASIHANTTFHDARLNTYLAVITTQWNMLAEQATETLDSSSGKLYIDNPYIPGNPLELHDPLFVGRNDIVQKLGQALQKRYRPAFLLSGERRMGKSSIIKQLPVLLGPRYIPIFYDLQSTGILASINAFLTVIMRDVNRQMKERGISLQESERPQTGGAEQQPMLVYEHFEDWLTEIEQVLQHEDRTLILAFDEFEKLEDAAQRGNIDLELLFDLFRNITQNRSHIVLLFSGAKMVGDMGRRWAGHFVNVERIKVSFLRPTEAYELVTRPVSNLFSDEIVQYIMEVSNGHPFLIQALCKSVIEHLNDNEPAPTRENMTGVTDRVFESWSGYFWDQWDRCDPEQRTFLTALSQMKSGTLEQIVRHVQGNTSKLLIAAEKLQVRDIVAREQGVYRFLVPLFALWIEKEYELLISIETVGTL